MGNNGESDFDNDTKPPQPQANQEEGDNPEEPEVSDLLDEDVERLHSQIDQLNSALDALEQKNENIQVRLLELLQSNRELRAQNHLRKNDHDQSVQEE